MRLSGAQVANLSIRSTLGACVQHRAGKLALEQASRRGGGATGAWLLGCWRPAGRAGWGS